MEEEECGATHVNQKIAWLQVAVPDIRRVNVLQRTEDLRSKVTPTATKCTSDGISPRGKHANTTMHWGGLPSRVSGRASGTACARTWYMKYRKCSSVSGWLLRMIWCRSVSISSVISYTSLKSAREAGGWMSTSAMICATQQAELSGGRHHARRGPAQHRGTQGAAAHVVVVEEPQQLNLAQRALGVRLVVERVPDLFHRDLAARRRVSAGAHDAVRPFPDGLRAAARDTARVSGLRS